MERAGGGRRTAALPAGCRRVQRRRRAGAAAQAGHAQAVAVPGFAADQSPLSAGAGTGPPAAQLPAVRRPAAQGRGLRRLGGRHHRRAHARPLPQRAGQDACADARCGAAPAHRLHRRRTGARAGQGPGRLRRRTHPQERQGRHRQRQAGVRRGAPRHHQGQQVQSQRQLVAAVHGAQAVRRPARCARTGGQRAGAAGAAAAGGLSGRGVRRARSRADAGLAGHRVRRPQRVLHRTGRAYRRSALDRAGQAPAPREGDRSGRRRPRRTAAYPRQYPGAQVHRRGTPVRGRRRCRRGGRSAFLLGDGDRPLQLCHRR